MDVSLSVRATTTELRHDELLLSDGRLPSRSLVSSVELGSVQARADHAQQQIRAVVLDVAAQDLLIDRDCCRALDIAKRVDRRANAEITDALNVRSCAFVLAIPFLTVLDGYFGEADTDGTDIASKNIATVESLSRPDCVIETLEVNCGIKLATV